MTDALKPCPFCGGGGTEKWAYGGAAINWIQCDACGAKGPHSGRIGHDGRGLRNWNRRVDLPVRVLPLVWVDNGDGWMMADGVGVQYWAEKGLDVSKHNAHHDARIRAALEG